MSTEIRDTEFEEEPVSLVCPAYMINTDGDDPDYIYLPYEYSNRHILHVLSIDVREEYTMVNVYDQTDDRNTSYDISHDNLVEIPLTITDKLYEKDWRYIAAMQGHMTDVLSIE